MYYMNYHSRLPMISAVSPPTPVSSALVQSTALNLGTANLVPAMIASGLFDATTAPAAMQSVVGAALSGVPASALPANLQPFYAGAASIAAANSRQIGFLTAAAGGRYLVEFPKNIHLFGASFNTSVKGIALQGEISYRDNQPLQIDDVELLFATLSSLNPAYGLNNQLGNYTGQLNTYVRGYKRHSVWTGQLTATYVGRGVLGADQSTVLAEAGFVNADLPAKSTLRYDGPGTFLAGDLNEMINTGSVQLADPSSAFADTFSWGYQLVGRLEYNNAFAGVNVAPTLIFGHDVSGNTPLPLGNFREERKTLTLGADFTFQNAWALEVRYVDFFGAGRYNLLGDRDYASVTLKYSF